jgi:integrase
MIAANVTRRSINGRIGRIRRMFRWGTENELVPAGVYEALRAVTGLREGRSGAREADPVRAVPDAHVEAVLPFVSAPVRGMILLHRHSGMRPGEARIMRSIDIDTTAALWEYRPSSHKTEHHGDDRVIMLGPRAQAILREFMADRPVDSFLFSPKDVPRGTAAFYTKEAYNRAVTRACKRAGVPTWRPNQLRHLSGTEIRKVAGLEGSQAWLGHKHARVSEVYAESNRSLARELAARYG